MSLILSRLPEKYSLLLSTILMGTQVFHLLWLTTNVLLPMTIGSHPVMFFYTQPLFTFLVVLDYIEIPALIMNGTYWAYAVHSALKYDGLRGSYNKKYLAIAIGTLSLVVLQVLHMFWITDEVLVQNLTGTAFVKFPFALALFAVLIDYSEIFIITSNVKVMMEKWGKKSE